MVEFRPQEETDAQAFLDILRSKSFNFFPPAPKTLEEEIEYIRNGRAKEQEGKEYNFTIALEGVIVGAVGLRKKGDGVAEAGYFIAENYQGKGIATQALKFVEEKAFSQYEFHRVQLIIAVENIGSIKVAEKNGYEQEGRLKQRMITRDGQKIDAYIYGKVK